MFSVRYTAAPTPIRVRSGGVVGDIHHCSSRGVDPGWGPGSRQGGFWEPLHRSPECFPWPAAPPCPAGLVLVLVRNMTEHSTTTGMATVGSRCEAGMRNQRTSGIPCNKNNRRSQISESFPNDCGLLVCVAF